ncbi:hypothetical protein GH984_10315 [Spiribacter sp. C176]|uniref:Undecaprenyl/decaprenyl-phosphate alpha-N-acetylglucosaminyl 1-phosphate transferase n=1 Tax=Spiribacter salilacus TaxID=2664894 RepID=A0A6N7QSX5_9GAMM|nr:MraY family glycosyltransferase [Spiribacter salilacus]MRH79092.1 hypothetical protein [Spiribacter salilacus]
MTPLWQSLAPALLVAFVLSAAGIKALRRPAQRWGFVDRPGGRKTHEKPTPTIGGLGLFLAFFLTLALMAPTSLIPATTHWPLWVSLLLLLGAGAVDDQRGLSVGPRLTVQLVCAGLLIGGGGVVLYDLGYWPGGTPMALGLLAVPITLMGIVGFVNAVNMMDGVDGVAGGTVFAMLGWLAVAALLADAITAVQIALILAAAVLGFLVHNLRSPLRRRASVFLGDAGSLGLGLVVIWLAMTISQHPDRVVSPWGIAWVVVLPVLDTLSLCIRRVMRGQSPFRADRAHLHHVLERAGFTPGQSAALLIAVTAALGAIGVVGSAIGVPDVLLATTLLIVAAAHYLFVRYAWRSTRALKRLRGWAAGRAQASTGADRVALLALYLAMAALPFGADAVVAGAGALLILATAGCAQKMAQDLRRLPLTWVVLGLSAWVSLAIALRPDPVWSLWLPMMGMSGVFALPLGWWFTRVRHHAAGLFAVLLLGILLAWLHGANWQMLEAGFIRNKGYWGDARTSGLLLALVLMPLVAIVAVGLGQFRQRWRARAALGVAMLLTVIMLMLLVAMQLQTAMAAALAGLIVMLLAAFFTPGITRRYALNLLISVGLLAVLSIAVAGVFKPNSQSLATQYLGPVQSALLYVGGEPELAAKRHPALASRIDTWHEGLVRIAERPLAGFGDAALPHDSPQSAYLALTQIGGLFALALYVAILGLLAAGLQKTVVQQRWRPVNTLAAQGLLGVVVALMLLTPVVSGPLGAVLVTAVLAVGVAGVVDTR